MLLTDRRCKVVAQWFLEGDNHNLIKYAYIEEMDEEFTLVTQYVDGTILRRSISYKEFSILYDVDEYDIVDYLY
jgi:hypothetical protein